MWGGQFWKEESVWRYFFFHFICSSTWFVRCWDHVGFTMLGWGCCLPPTGHFREFVHPWWSIWPTSLSTLRVRVREKYYLWRNLWRVRNCEHFADAISTRLLKTLGLPPYQWRRTYPNIAFHIPTALIWNPSERRTIDFYLYFWRHIGRWRSGRLMYITLCRFLVDLLNVGVGDKEITKIESCNWSNDGGLFFCQHKNDTLLKLARNVVQFAAK